MKYIIAIATALLINNNSFAQGYQIEVEIAGLADTTAFLGNYFGESTYLKDTALVDSEGHFTFSGNTPLDEGSYFVVLGKTRIFDFLIGKDQEFQLKTSTKGYYENLKAEGSELNTLYIDDLKFNMERNAEAEPFVAILRDSTTSETARKEARENLDAINDKVMVHQQEIISKHPDMLLSRIFKANQRIEIPETPEGMDETEFAYAYMKDHYWDKLNLGDAAMLRIGRPVYKEKLEGYFDRLVMPDADSIIKEINTLAPIAKANSDTYKYFIWTLTLKYQNPDIMGLDRVFVELIDQYFQSGEMDFWANTQLKKNLKERADQLRMSLIGNKAPNMIMMDTDKQMRSLYDISNKYTVIYFFDPDCGHCKKETPVLKEFYDNTNFDVEVFAVSADTSMNKMSKYIQDMGMNWITVNGPRTATGSYHTTYDAMTTPTIYVLDNRKKIIAKKISAARLEDFLTQYEKFHSEADKGQ